MHLSNEWIWLIFLLIDMTAVVAVYRFFGKEGLMAYVVLAIITCNIEVVKQVDLFGLSVTLGNILYGSLFLTSDILAEVYGKKAAQKAVLLGFVAMAMMTLFMQLSLWMAPGRYDQAQDHLKAVFGFLPRITLGSLLAYLLSQLHDIWAFLLIKKIMKGRALWFRNNVATLVSQAIDTVVFTLVALAPLPFLPVVPGFDNWDNIFTLAWTAYILKLVVSVADTPFVYWARKIGRERYGIDSGVKINEAAPQSA